MSIDSGRPGRHVHILLQLGCLRLACRKVLRAVEGRRQARSGRPLNPCSSYRRPVWYLTCDQGSFVVAVGDEIIFEGEGPRASGVDHGRLVGGRGADGDHNLGGSRELAVAGGKLQDVDPRYRKSRGGHRGRGIAESHSGRAADLSPRSR